MKLCQPRQKKTGCRKELTGRKDALHNLGQTIITSKEGHLESTSSIRGVYPPLFHFGPSTRKRNRRAEVNERHILYRESSPCPPKRTEDVNKKQKQSGKTSLIPTSPAKEGQVLMTCRAKTSLMEDKNSPCSSREAMADVERPVWSRQIQPRRSSPYDLRSRHQSSGRQEQSSMSRIQPYK
ncbi:hypothetical protein TNIN_200361 [Trichonephila inaurata madagascariensis]|uniref:Uncharacterized protein n=1 Tax=Trichonephila inaurata madagascariensis TaxID=2747483 RepID=A0A8X6WXB9_9ARAC|nr:hypothetical protein TNIN_200361 [Trichonephila inaurata madagascariensis]